MKEPPASRTSWAHDHTFGQDRRRPGERRTHLVIALTLVMMGVELVSGLVFGSMALLADGLHMASHACALTISALAYFYTRRHARDPELSFGAGKMNSLGGFTGAVLLAVFSVLMAWESVARLLSPVDIDFNEAIAVAIVGLVVNGACMLLLGHGHERQHDHAHHDHDHDHDHNLRSAYFHVLADALTSFLAIFALLGGKYLDLHFMDPVMGIVGAVLVARWSIGLLRTTSAVLLDKQAPADMRDAIREAIEGAGDARVVDLHVWAVSPGLYSVIVSVVADDPLPPERYKERLPRDLPLVHETVEVHRASP